MNELNKQLNELLELKIETCNIPGEQTVTIDKDICNVCNDGVYEQCDCYRIECPDFFLPENFVKLLEIEAKTYNKLTDGDKYRTVIEPEDFINKHIKTLLEHLPLNQPYVIEVLKHQAQQVEWKR